MQETKTSDEDIGITALFAKLGTQDSGSTERDINPTEEKRLADAMVRMINKNPAVQRAILNFVMSCPNVVTEY